MMMAMMVVMMMALMTIMMGMMLGGEIKSKFKMLMTNSGNKNVPRGEHKKMAMVMMTTMIWK